jgi:hypothetical protein
LFKHVLNTRRRLRACALARLLRRCALKVAELEQALAEKRQAHNEAMERAAQRKQQHEGAC